MNAPSTNGSSNEQQISSQFKPIKLNFVRKYAKAFGKLTRTELEEVLLQKVTESLVYRSKILNLQQIQEKQEVIIENLKGRLDMVVKYSQDLEVIQKRLIRDMREHPEAPLEPLRIQRDVGLQVYSATESENFVETPIEILDEDDDDAPVAKNRKKRKNDESKENESKRRKLKKKSNKESFTDDSLNSSHQSPQKLVRKSTDFSAQASPPQISSTPIKSKPFELPQLPAPPQDQKQSASMKSLPPKPTIKIAKSDKGITVSWCIDNLNTNEHADIRSYEIFAYEMTEKKNEGWKRIGDVQALLLPMAVNLTQFKDEQKFHFAIRAIDCHQRYGEFSLPKTWEDKKN